MQSGYRRFTLIGVFLCLLGAQIVYIDVGSIRLSPYRVYLLCALFVVTELFANNSRRSNKLGLYKYLYFVLGWFVYGVASVSWIIDFSGWLNALIMLLGGLLISILVFEFLNDFDDITSVLKIVTLVSTAYASLAAIEILTGNFMFLQDENKAFYGESSFQTSILNLPIPVTVFGNPNNYALFLGFAVFSSTVLCFTTKTNFDRSLYFTTAVVFSFLILATQSRAGLMALIVFSLSTILGLGKILNSRLSTIGVVFLFLTVIGFSRTALLDWNSITSLLSFDFESAESGSDSIRLNLIKNGFVLLHEKFYLGVGLGQIETYMDSGVPYYTAGVTNMHNWWMEIITSSGIVIFGWYVIIYIKSIINMLVNLTKGLTLDLKILNLCGVGFLLAFLVGSVGPSSVTLTEWVWPLMAIVMKVPFIKNDGKVGFKNAHSHNSIRTFQN